MSYKNPAHRHAFETACETASSLSLEALQAGDIIEKITQQIRVLPGMYQKRRLCKQIAEKAVQAEVAKRQSKSPQ
ncbi:MAG TPA: hypothetical protein PKM21_09785 [Anaerolineales bacterium]|nr:hypothetical protein [Anaerolineales bacterium]